MGQIIGGAAKPKRCNANQLSQMPTPAAGEHILVSSDNSMNAAGQGNFDCYIEGDGQTAAEDLPLHTIADDEIIQGSKNSVTGGCVHEVLYGLEEQNIVPSEVVSDICYISSSGLWLINNTNQTGKYFPVEGGREITIVANGSDSSYYAFIKEPPVSSAVPTYASGETKTIMNAGTSVTRIIPNDAAYLWFAIKSYAHDFTPSSIVIAGSRGFTQELTDIKSDVEKLTDKVFPEEYTSSAIPLYASTLNAGIRDDGRAITDTSLILKKYKVSEGQLLHLTLEGLAHGTYQFQTSAVVPGSVYDTNEFLVGSTITGGVDADVVVPATAEYLIVAELQTNTTNKVMLLSRTKEVTVLKFENGGIGDDGRNNPSWRENNFFRCFRTGNYIKADKLYYTPIGSEVVSVFTYTGELKLIEKQVITTDFTPDADVAFMKVQVFFNATDNVVNVATEQGSLGTLGEEETSDNWIRTGYIDIDNANFDSMWFLGKLKYRFYDEQHNILSSGESYARGQQLCGGLAMFSSCKELLLGSPWYEIKSTAKYIRIAFANEAESAITPSSYDLRFTNGDLPHLQLPEILAANYAETLNEYISSDTITFAYKFNAVEGQQVSASDVSTAQPLYDNSDYYSTGVLLLPPNYSHNGKPVPLIIFVHGSGNYSNLGEKVFGNYYMEYFAYWQKEGFAVVDFYARTSKYGSVGGDVNGMPTNLASYEQGYKWLVEHYNIDKSGCYVGAKSMGGVGALMICYSKAIPVKAADLFAPALNPFYQQCGYGIGSRMDYVADLRLDNAEALLTNPSPSAPMEQDAFNSLMIANKDKLVGYNAYLSKVVNKTWEELVPLKFKNSNAFNDVVKLCDVPFRIHIAEDDTTVAYQQSLNLIKAMKNSGSRAEIRTLPANTGAHHATDSDENALKVSSITTKLGYTCTDVPLAYVEAVSWFRYYK